MNRTFLLTSAIAVLSTVMATGCKSNEHSETATDLTAEVAKLEENDITRNYDFTGFNGITADGAVTIRFTQGSDYNVKITCNKDILSRITIKKSGNTLNIHTKGSTTITTTDLKDLINDKTGNKYPVPTVYITAPKLETVHLMGATSIKGETLKASGFSAVIDGAAKLELDTIKSKTINIINNGAGYFNAFIEADNAEIDNNGAGRANIKYKGESLKLSNNGAANLKADVDCKSVKSANNGAGKIKLSGTADKTDIVTSGVAKTDVEELNKL